MINHYSKAILLTVGCIFSASLLIGQNVGINTDGSVPGLMLDVKSPTADDGIRINNTAGTGDALINFQFSGVDEWTLGVDDSDLDEFKISRSGALGTSNAFTINSNRQLMSGIAGTEALPAWGFDGDANTGLWQPAVDQFALSVGGVEFMTIVEGGTDVITFNNDLDDMDFQIKGDLEVDLFYVDGANNRVGIMNGTPTYFFHMTEGGNGIGAAPLGHFENNGTTGLALSVYNVGTTNAYNGFEGLTAGTYTGTVGIGLTTGAGADGVFGNTNDWQSVGVVGSRFNSGGADTGFGGLFYNDLGYTGGFWFVSDASTKKDINEMEGAMAKIMQLRPVTYHYDTEKYPTMGLSNRLEYGFIAQEVEQVLPMFVKHKLLDVNASTEATAHTASAKKKEEFVLLDYTRFVPLLTKAVQEQQTTITDLQSQVDALEAKIARLEQLIQQ